MDELKLLIDMVSALPALALWVLVGFWAYKVIMIGSIYGLVRFIVAKVHSYATHEPAPKPVALGGKLSEITIDNCVSALMTQLGRLRGKAVGIDSSYIHQQSVNWLSDAIDDKEKKDAKEKVTA